MWTSWRIFRAILKQANIHSQSLCCWMHPFLSEHVFGIYFMRAHVLCTFSLEQLHSRQHAGSQDSDWRGTLNIEHAQTFQRKEALVKCSHVVDFCGNSTVFLHESLSWTLLPHGRDWKEVFYWRNSRRNYGYRWVIDSIAVHGAFTVMISLVLWSGFCSTWLLCYIPSFIRNWLKLHLTNL